MPPSGSWLFNGEAFPTLEQLSPIQRSLSARRLEFEFLCFLMPSVCFPLFSSIFIFSQSGTIIEAKHRCDHLSQAFHPFPSCADSIPLITTEIQAFALSTQICGSLAVPLNN
jgi:hypothetical protein